MFFLTFILFLIWLIVSVRFLFIYVIRLETTLRCFNLWTLKVLNLLILIFFCCKYITSTSLIIILISCLCLYASCNFLSIFPDFNGIWTYLGKYWLFWNMFNLKDLILSIQLYTKGLFIFVFLFRSTLSLFSLILFYISLNWSGLFTINYT